MAHHPAQQAVQRSERQRRLRLDVLGPQTPACPLRGRRRPAKPPVRPPGAVKHRRSRGTPCVAPLPQQQEGLRRTSTLTAPFTTPAGGDRRGPRRRQGARPRGRCGPCPRYRNCRHPRRPFHRRYGSIGVGKVDPRPRPCRPRHHPLPPGAARRRRPDDPHRAGAHATAPRPAPVRVPGLQTHPVADRRRKHRAAAHPGRQAPRRRLARPSRRDARAD